MVPWELDCAEGGGGPLSVIPVFTQLVLCLEHVKCPPGMQQGGKQSCLRFWGCWGSWGSRRGKDLIIPQTRLKMCSCSLQLGVVFTFQTCPEVPAAQDSLCWAEGQEEPCAGAQRSYPVSSYPLSRRISFPICLAPSCSQAALTEPIWSEETFAELLGSGELQSSVTGAGGGWGWGALPGLM